MSLLAAAADPVRWRLAGAIWRRREPTACVLREAGLVTAAKRGRWVDYTLAGDAGQRLRRALPTVALLAEERR